MKHPVMASIAILLVLGFFAVLGMLIYAGYVQVAIDGTLKDILLVLLGVLGTMTTTVVNYYFGSSLGSAAKDVLLAQK